LRIHLKVDAIMLYHTIYKHHVH